MKGKSIMGNVYGYIRVSSKDQNEDRQVITMHKMQVPVENIYILISSPAKISIGHNIGDCYDV